MPQSKNLRLTLAQLNATVGDIDGNAEKLMRIWKEHDEYTDLVLFPELFLCGYPPEDLVLNGAFIKKIHRKIQKICDLTENHASAALIPTAWAEEDRVYNAALLIEAGQIKHVFHKRMLPNYYVFDEQRTFHAGERPIPYQFRGHNLGIMICEDIWHVELPQHLKEHGAEILIAINASPYHDNQEEKRVEVCRAATKAADLNLFYLNLTGGQDELVFDGNSFIMQHNGEILHKAAPFKEDIIRCTVKTENEKPKQQLFSITFGQDNSKETFNYLENHRRAITAGIRDYVHKNGFSKVILGLSGGIDSALTALLAVEAIGRENVHCYMLPSEFTSEESLKDAKACAGSLLVKYDIIEIKDAIKIFEKTIPNLNGLAHENTQSRIRGLILMALSNISGALLLSTGNKSEMAVGYCTLYGDMNGAYNPLKDLYKTEVYKLAEHLELKPETIITKAPSAELRPDQKDEDSLPPYEILDEILKALIEYDNHDHSEMNYDFNEQDVKQVAKLLKISEYKRFQSCPGPRLTQRAFGRDRRYPMTNEFINQIEGYK